MGVSCHGVTILASRSGVTMATTLWVNRIRLKKKSGTGFEIRDGSVTRCEVVEQKEGLNGV